VIDEAPRKLVSAFVLASFLDCSVATIYQKAKARQLPHFRVGDRVLFDVAQVLASIAKPAENTDDFEFPKITAGRGR
jgi:hypothetical protein